MQRTTITLDDDLAADLDRYLDGTGALSRSEAIRDLLRRGLSARSEPPAGAECFGILSYVADLGVRNLAARLPQGRLDRHDQIVAAVTVPLDHSHAVEVAVMRGDARAIAAYAEALFLERGVMHGTMGMIPLAQDEVAHVHAGDDARHTDSDDPGAAPHAHRHLRVRPSF